ncbi:hypothetical protein C8R46DRAFT_1064580 [Mycena filopes]|nr:hypothetical protein C8R46DRAFT_1064580 [Mycena filopes]
MANALRRWLYFFRRKAGRLDVRRRPPLDQPNCALLSLPAELRRCIYEHALGGHMIFVKLNHTWPRSDSLTHPHYLVRTRYYDRDRARNLRDGPSKLGFPVEGINPALFLSCRQVYLEALPILYGSNTFYFLAHQVATIVQSALGPSYLSEIRSVYLFEIGRVHSWPDVSLQLQKMRLTTLSLTLESLYIQTKAGVDLVDTPWAHGILAIRNLRVFELTFTRDVVSQKELAERCRQLMIGPGADEKYAEFLLENQERS